MPFHRRAIATVLAVLMILPTFAQSAGAASPALTDQAPNDGAVAIPGPPPPEEQPVLEAIAANDDRRASAIRRAGLAGIAAGIILAGAGFAVMYREAGSDPDVPAIHAGIGLVISGGLIAALSSAAARYHRESQKVIVTE